ncbi:MAG: hypothetical protein RJA10_4757, partial [Pseudomonadota bacterium]
MRPPANGRPQAPVPGTRRWLGAVVALVLACLGPLPAAPARAQDEPPAEAGSPIRVLDAETAAALARRLAQPRPPAGAPEAELRRHYTEQVDAARRLGDLATQERVLREALDALPQDARWPNDMGLLLRDAGRLD